MLLQRVYGELIIRKRRKIEPAKKKQWKKNKGAEIKKKNILFKFSKISYNIIIKKKTLNQLTNQLSRTHYHYSPSRSIQYDQSIFLNLISMEFLKKYLQFMGNPVCKRSTTTLIKRRHINCYFFYIKYKINCNNSNTTRQQGILIFKRKIILIYFVKYKNLKSQSSILGSLQIIIYSSNIPQNNICRGWHVILSPISDPVISHCSLQSCCNNPMTCLRKLKIKLNENNCKLFNTGSKHRVFFFGCSLIKYFEL